MSARMLKKQQRRLEMLALTFARAASTSSILIGLIGILGWVLHLDVLRSVYPYLVLIPANSSIALVFVGFGLRVAVAAKPNRLAAVACILIITVLAGGTLAEYVLDKDLGIDQLIFHDSVNNPRAPVRMAPTSVIVFLAISLALLLVLLEWAIPLAQLMSLLASFIGVLAITGYIFRLTVLYAIGKYTPMSVQMAVMAAVLGLGVLCCRPQRGLMTVLASSNVGGIVARRLLPFGMGFPLLLGALSYLGQLLKLGKTPFGALILLFVGIVMFTAPVLWTAVLLYRTDQKRERAEQEVAKQYEEIHRLNRALSTHSQQLEDANKELEAFSYSVSHDLRAPLRHISGFVELLKERSNGTLDAQSLRYLTVIAEACIKMGDLVDDLLAFSRMSRAEMLKAQVDLNQIVQQILMENEPVVGQRRIDWVVQPLPAVQGDVAMIRLVLTNYISNAVKYTQKKDAARIEIGRVQTDTAEVAVYVKDNGAGFDMKYVGKLFGVFQRLHRDDEFEGTGIGLATARRIINRHGGRTWAEGQLNTGATFYFSLPV
jgi:signal transduction histidine kinase